MFRRSWIAHTYAGCTVLNCYSSDTPMPLFKCVICARFEHSSKTNIRLHLKHPHYQCILLFSSQVALLKMIKALLKVACAFSLVFFIFEHNCQAFQVIEVCSALANMLFFSGLAVGRFSVKMIAAANISSRIISSFDGPSNASSS